MSDFLVTICKCKKKSCCEFFFCEMPTEYWQWQFFRDQNVFMKARRVSSPLNTMTQCTSIIWLFFFSISTNNELVFVLFIDSLSSICQRLIIFHQNSFNIICNIFITMTKNKKMYVSVMNMKIEANIHRYLYIWEINVCTVNYLFYAST